MKTQRPPRALVLSVVLVLSAIVASIAATGSFVGTMEFTTTKDGKPSPLTYIANGKKVRFDIPVNGQEVNWILQPDVHRGVFVMPLNKLYIERDLPNESISDSSRKEYGEPMDSGVRDSVIGYPCQVWTSTGTNGIVHKMWLTGGIGVFWMYDGDPSKAIHEPPAMELIRERGMFPLRIVDMRGSVEVSRFEATAVDLKVPQDSMFVVPLGYKVMSVPAISGK